VLKRNEELKLTIAHTKNHCPHTGITTIFRLPTQPGQLEGLKTLGLRVGTETNKTFKQDQVMIAVQNWLKKQQCFCERDKCKGCRHQTTQSDTRHSYERK